MKRVLLVALAAALSACATVTRGVNEMINVQSTPTLAEVRFSNGQTCVTPCAIQVGRNEELIVTISKAGHETRVVTIKAVAAAMGVGAGVVGNAILGGVVGFGVDAVTGAMLEHCPNPLGVVLRPLDRNGVPQGPEPVNPTDKCFPPPPEHAPPSQG